MPRRWFEIRGGLVALRRTLTLLVAGGIGWVLASHWLAAQEPWLVAPSTRATGSQAKPLPGCTAEELANGPAGQAFWATPTPLPTPPGEPRATITKVPFRYGDFGATSYPIRHQSKGYYRSRTDWVWQ